MSWNTDAKKSGLVMGTWYWYRALPTTKPFPVWVYSSMGVEYAWLSDPHHAYRQTQLVECCTGEFLGKLEVPQ